MLSRELDKYLNSLVIADEQLHRLACQFSKTFRHLALTPGNQFLPTPVADLPTGSERGRFLAIDLGGSNLRVGLVELYGAAGRSDNGRTPSQTCLESSIETKEAPVRVTFERSWPIGDHLKMNKADDLFAWIGDCIAKVVADIITFSLHYNETVSRELALGITFSFPMIQGSLAEATVMPMGKGFAVASNVDLPKLVLAGYETARHKASINTDYPVPIKRLPSLRVVAIANDTVSTLASLAYSTKNFSNSKVAMAMIVGTGTNATIPIRLVDLHASKTILESSQFTESRSIVVNTEWSINGTFPPLRDLDFITKWDKLLDEGCEVPGFQPLEQMTSGRYLGELVRIILLDIFTKELKIQPCEIPTRLKEKNSLTTTLVATAFAKAQPKARLLAQVQEQLPSSSTSTWRWTAETAEIVWSVARIVQIRASSLIAAATTGLLDFSGDLHLRNRPIETTKGENRVGKERKSQVNDTHELIVACTGGTINLYPSYLETCQERIDKLLQTGNTHQNTRVTLREASNGGMIGAAVLAATAVDACL
ncbi:MAG: hypothetical protein M1812_000683 [Candelaria pacifica]|nr:MAG: hypothetical protein M1812_000683 [Candelaria pacifica]